MLCIEVLSPEDRLSRVMIRVQDFLTMGVPEVWIFDFKLRTVQVCTGTATTTHSSNYFTIPGSQVTLSLSEVFQALDE